MKKHLTLLITLNSGFLVKVRVSFSQNYELRTRKFEQSTIKRKEDRILAINQGEANQPSEAVKSNLELTAERTDYYLIEPWVNQTNSSQVCLLLTDEIYVWYLAQ